MNIGGDNYFTTNLQTFDMHNMQVRESLIVAKRRSGAIKKRRLLFWEGHKNKYTPFHITSVLLLVRWEEEKDRGNPNCGRYFMDNQRIISFPILH